MVPYGRAVAQVPLLSAVEGEALAQLAQATNTELFKPGDCIIRQGVVGWRLLVWESGEASVTVEGVGEVARKRRGDFAGEVSLLRTVHTTATVTALSECTYLSISRADFRRYVMDTMGQYSRIELLLSQVPIISNLAPAKRLQLAQQMKECSFAPGKPIIRATPLASNRDYA